MAKVMELFKTFKLEDTAMDFSSFFNKVIPFIGSFAPLFVPIFSLIRGTIRWNDNDLSPVLVVDAKVISKRMLNTRIQPYHTRIPLFRYSVSTYTCLATFEVESGNRMELEIPEKRYSLITERDFGRLTFQGTRYIKFKRERIKD